MSEKKTLKVLANLKQEDIWSKENSQGVSLFLEYLKQTSINKLCPQNKFNNDYFKRMLNES